MAISLAEVSPNDEVDYVGGPNMLHEYSKRIVKLIGDCGTIQKAVCLATTLRPYFLGFVSTSKLARSSSSLFC